MAKFSVYGYCKKEESNHPINHHEVVQENITVCSNIFHQTNVEGKAYTEASICRKHHFN